MSSDDKKTPKIIIDLSTEKFEQKKNLLMLLAGSIVKHIDTWNPVQGLHGDRRDGLEVTNITNDSVVLKQSWIYVIDECPGLKSYPEKDSITVEIVNIKNITLFSGDRDIGVAISTSLKNNKAYRKFIIDRWVAYHRSPSCSIPSIDLSFFADSPDAMTYFILYHLRYIDMIYTLETHNSLITQ